MRGVLLGAYLGGVIGVLGAQGISLDKQIIVAIVLGALLVWCIGRPLSEARRLLCEWLPFIAAILCYDAARAGAHALDRPVLVMPQIRAERFIFGTLPTRWLQTHFLHARVHWWDVAATLVYVSHFFVTFVVAGWMWTRDRARWSEYAARLVVLSFLGAVTFAIFPTAPPWAAATMGRIGPVTRSAAHGWSALHLREPEVLLQQGRDLVNPYAAIPSLHAGYALLVAIALWPFARRAVRVLLAAYPLAMGLTVVYTGEHYVVDVLIGFVYVALAIKLERRGRTWLRERVQRRSSVGSSTSVERQPAGALTGSHRAGVPPGIRTM